jgi:very-short-patch-repair endonuclease
MKDMPFGNVAVVDEDQPPRRLPGLYPWLRFEIGSVDEWIEWHGIYLDHANATPKAANTYLAGERRLLVKFEEDHANAVGVGRHYAIPRMQQALENNRSEFNHAAAKLCNSPIEVCLLAALAYGINGEPAAIWDSEMFPDDRPARPVVIAPQYHIDEHRVDFAVFVRGLGEEVRIVVECDGHDFHEKTKEQAASDKRRDRDIQIAGWKVLRFTGSEIWRDCWGCANAVSRLAASEIEAQIRRRGFSSAT